MLESFCDNCGRRKLVVLVILIQLILVIFCIGFSPFYNPAWIGCYVIGYALGRNEKEAYFKRETLTTIFGILSSMNIIQIWIEYISKIELSGTKRLILLGWEAYNHVFLGLFVFLLFMLLLDKIELEKNEQLILFLEISDEYSYETYLVHQFVILGPFSLMKITRYLPINILIIVLAIMVLSWMLHNLNLRVEIMGELLNGKKYYKSIAN